MKVSYIVATFNSARYLRECLESIVNKGGTTIGEVLVIDGGSSDRSLEIVNQCLSGVPHSIHLQKSKGLYEALNEAVTLAAFPFIMFVHSDDLLAEIGPSTLPSSDMEITVGYVDIFREGMGIACRRRPPVFHRKWLSTYPFIFHPNAIYPRNLLLKHPFDPGRYGRRADMFQIASLGRIAKFRRVNDLGYLFRIHCSSTTVKAVPNAHESTGYWFFRLYVFMLFENRRIARLWSSLTGRGMWKVASNP